MAYGIFDSSLIGKVFDIMDNMGVFEYILPWMLYYALIYGLLSRVNILGKNKSNEQQNNKDIEDPTDKINRILAMTIATLLLYYVPESRTLSQFLSEIFTKWSVFLITLLLIPITISIFGVKIKDLVYEKDENDKEKITPQGWTIIGVAVLIIFIIFYNTLGNMFRDFWIIVNPYNIAITITLVILAFIIVSALRTM